MEVPAEMLNSMDVSSHGARSEVAALLNHELTQMDSSRGEENL